MKLEFEFIKIFSYSIPSKIIKDNCDIFGEKLYIDFNLSVDSGLFPRRENVQIRITIA